MHSSARQLLGRWVVELVHRYFEAQWKMNGDKLFTKIVGIDESAWGEVLEAFQEAENRLAKYYKPVLRTLKPVERFHNYQCEQHETSTWLRNNTSPGSALLILMNETSPEAQSLENIFTIDEARLLSMEGMEVLYQLFATTYKCYGDELNTLKVFLSMYSRLSEPQLRNVLVFLSALILDERPSMIDSIQQNLDKLLLFRDSRLTIRSSDGFPRLKRNYQLSRLEYEGKSSKKEDFIENLYKFLEKSSSPQDMHELWERVSPDIFRQQAMDFIHNQSQELLQYEYDHVSSALLFKIGKPKLNERIGDFKLKVESQGALTLDKDRLITETLEAIDDTHNPDKIQEFIDEFADDLREIPNLRKLLERTIVRQRQLPEYNDISEALLRESILLLEEYEAEAQPTEVRFVLALNQAVSKSMHAVLCFYLLQLERLTGFIHFDAASLDQLSESDKDTEISFLLRLYVEGNEVSNSKFKLIHAFGGKLPGMIDNLLEAGHIPYIREYEGNDTRLLDVVAEVKDRVSGYVATEYPGVRETADAFYEFVRFFTIEIHRALHEGLCNVEIGQLEQNLERVLSHIHHSALLSKSILQFVSCLGAIDRYDCRMNEPVGHAHTRILTLFNPIRLISYAKRLQHIKEVLSDWVFPRNGGTGHIEDMKAYLQQLQEETSRLSPHYFVIEGVQDQFLIEQQECMGEGTFTLNGQSGGEEKFVDTFAEEFLSTVHTYLDVYPYAKDCLDLVFLYCPHAEYVIGAVERIFKYTTISKVKAIVHCEKNGAVTHEALNSWMNREERYSERPYSFPRVELQVIAEQSINAMMQSVTHYLQDADIGVLINYFGRTSHIQYKLEKVTVKDSINWFDTIYKEPLKKDDAVKRISYISESLPKVMQSFYQMQYILHSNETLGEDEHYLLRNVISIMQLSDTVLINYMHDQFNWSLFIDRYLDKSLLRQVSSKAQIIKYKSKAGSNKDYRTLLSSSKYIRKLASELADHEYYDRLHQKYVLLLKNADIDSQIIVKATERVKEISGGAVLRAIGPGKFAHEMMAIYLATQARTVKEGELVVWSVCDELPWFQGSVRRPDLVCTSITRTNERILLHFELIELKFISHTIFEMERYDAIKQVKAGLDLYTSRFLFQQHPTSGELWRKELIYYLLEYGTYSVEDALLLKELQAISLDRIDVTVSGSIDTFIYTSNLLDRSLMEGHQGGYQTELLHNEFTNHIYNRAYILRALGAAKEDLTPSYDLLQELEEFVTNKLGLNSEVEVAPLPEGQEDTTDKPVIPEALEQIVAQQEASSLAYVAAAVSHEPLHAPLFVEQIALADEPGSELPRLEDMMPLAASYQRKLRYNFNQLGISIKIVDVIIGVSVIRIILEIPVNISYSNIENRAKDIYLWLQLSSVPLIALRNGRINIDINRDTPETVLFESLMKQTREQFLPEKLKGRLIAPIGIGQLRELITLDFSSSNTPHLLVGGTTGSGKSVTINSIILAMMCLYDPTEVQFLFVDPKKVEFLTYESRCHTKQVLTEIEEAIQALEQLVEEMEQRYALFAAECVMSIDEYVEVTASPMPRLIVVFDEFADFMEREKALSGRVESAILRLGAKARAAGIHLIICTQNPKADIIPTNIRNNLPARLALKAADHHASKIIINEEGAEKLGGKGDFLIKNESPGIIRARSPYLTPRVKRALLQYFTKKE